MKTQIITLFTALVLSTGIAATTYAAPVKNDNNVTVLTDISAINKIEVRGNVTLYVSDGSADEVKVYNKFYSEDAVVKSSKGVLSIASYKAEKLVVWVTAADLRAIDAYDNSEVRSFGQLSKIDFNVELHNTASAKLNIDAYTATVNVYDNAKADLTGNADKFNLQHSVGSSVNNSNFKAVSFTEKRTSVPAEAKNEDITIL
jgi:Putative auto-transporter adhesin, head GIN domain